MTNQEEGDNMEKMFPKDELINPLSTVSKDEQNQSASSAVT